MYSSKILNYHGGDITALTGLLIAVAAVMWLHPKVVRIAHQKGITDNPDHRKLQSKPIPVLGGTVLFFGISSGMVVTAAGSYGSEPVLIMSLLALMLYTGTVDDISGLTPGSRLAIEVLASLVMIFAGGYEINDFHGLFGIGRLHAWVSIPLTVTAVTGIINSINLIDGVDGLSSGYCMMICVLAGVYFHSAGDWLMLILTGVCFGSLLPFFVHNVFGKRQKMFIGDGGTLQMGLLLSFFVLRILSGSGSGSGMLCCGSGIAYALSLLSIPVFDTLRVMLMRIRRGVSPFCPDRTHLHHAFVGIGFSHISTTTAILLLEGLSVLVWRTIYEFGFSPECQIFVVTATGIMFTAGIYGYIGYITRRRMWRKSNHK